jgi:hypothetical protein
MSEILVLPPPSNPGSLARLLAQLPALVARLVEHGSLHEVADARHKTEVLRSYAAKAKLGREAQDTAAPATRLTMSELALLSLPRDQAPRPARRPPTLRP